MKTRRDIMVVYVPQVKSMWVGQSEKNIKALFDRYREQVKKAAVTPILLFNEADAIIGVRKQGDRVPWTRWKTLFRISSFRRWSSLTVS